MTYYYGKQARSIVNLYVPAQDFLPANNPVLRFCSVFSAKGL